MCISSMHRNDHPLFQQSKGTPQFGSCLHCMIAELVKEGSQRSRHLWCCTRANFFVLLFMFLDFVSFVKFSY